MSDHEIPTGEQHVITFTVEGDDPKKEHDSEFIRFQDIEHEIKHLKGKDDVVINTPTARIRYVNPLWGGILGNAPRDDEPGDSIEDGGRVYTERAPYDKQYFTREDLVRAIRKRISGVVGVWVNEMTLDSVTMYEGENYYRIVTDVSCLSTRY